MAVGPFRTLLAAHAQASVNRVLKEMGRMGLAVTVIVAVLLVLSLALPLVVGALIFGWSLGSELPRLSPIIFLGLLSTAASAGAGVLNGLLGETRHLAWESYRSFPVPPRTLLVAEILASLCGWVPLLFATALVSLMAGLSIAWPHLIPLHLLILAGLLSTLLLAQFLAGSLASVLAQRHRITLVVLFAVGIVLAVYTGWKDAIRQVIARQFLEQGSELPFDPLKDPLLENLVWLPGVSAMKGLAHAIRGDWALALAHQLPSLLLVVLLSAAAWLVARSGVQPPRADSYEGPSARGWSFRSPTGGIARLQWVTLLGSQQGRISLVMPLFTLFVMKNFASAFLQGSTSLTAPAAFLYLCLISGPLLFNQFGLDGHGVKALLLLPLSPRELLQGKALGFAAFACLQSALLVVLLLLTRSIDGIQVAAGLLFAGCVFVVQNSVGQWTSAWMPRGIRRNGKSGAPLPMPVVFIHFGVSLGSGAIFGGLYLLLALFAPAWLVPGMAAALALCGLVYSRLLPLAADYLLVRQEALVQALG